MDPWNYLTVPVMLMAALEPTCAPCHGATAEAIPILAAGPNAAADHASPRERHAFTAANLLEPHEKDTPPSETEEAADAEAAVPAAQDSLNVYDRLEIRERADDLTGITSAASEGSTGYLDLKARPITRTGELLETTPGMIATQHSGGGKANQYFLRGFNLDHGTDFSVRVSGVPVNMPSHGHGQGYADLSFVIPEAVDRVVYRKGTYHAGAGDFSAAGSVDMRMRRRFDEGFVQLTGGKHDLARAVVADSFSIGGGDLTAAFELSRYDGPWTRPGDFDKHNLLLSYQKGDATRGWGVTLKGYDGEWLSTDQIPLREVEAGRLGRFDLVDPGPRGSTERYSVALHLHRGGDNWLSSISGYALAYDFSLISNFTYFLDDPQLGDQFEQIDDRAVYGLDGRYEWLSEWSGRRIETRAGFDLRLDDIDNGLFRTADLVRTSAVREDSIDQLGAGLWADTRVRWTDRVRTVLGLRADYYDADVTSSLALNSGSADDYLLSPSASLLVGPLRATELFLNVGWGYHSNDARGATIRVDPVSGEPARRVEPLVRARGAEVGLRTTRRGWTSSVAVFGLELDSELVFVGDGGATEASRPSRRLGIEWTNYFRVNRWLALDADLTRTDSEFSDDDPAGTEIPGSIANTVAAGITINDLGRFSGSIRWRRFSDIPLVEDDSVNWGASSLVNAAAAYRIANGLELRLEVFNLFDSDESDVEYFYASRRPGEPTGGIEDVHFHPAESRTARLSLRWSYRRNSD